MWVWSLFAMLHQVANMLHICIYTVCIRLLDCHTVNIGTFGLLWCLKFESIIVKSIETYKRVSMFIRYVLVQILLSNYSLGYEIG